MERGATEIVRDEVTGTVREESHVTQDTGAGRVMDSAEVVSTATPARRTTEAIYLVFGIIDGLLLIRLVLQLLAAPPPAGCSKFICRPPGGLPAPPRDPPPTLGGASGA